MPCCRECSSKENFGVSNAFDDISEGERPFPKDWVESVGSSVFQGVNAKAFAVYRVVCACFLFGFSINVGVQNPEMFVRYLTNWTFFLQTFWYIILAYVSVNAAFLPGRLERAYAPWYAKTAVVLNSIVIPGGLLVTVVFWILLYQPPGSLLDFVTHLVNSLLIVTELVLNFIPIRITYFWMPLVYGIIYCLWTVIHAFSPLENNYSNCEAAKLYNQTEIDNECNYIYGIINWVEAPVLALIVTLGLCLVGNPLMTVLTWAIKDKLIVPNARPVNDAASTKSLV